MAYIKCVKFDDPMFGTGADGDVTITASQTWDSTPQNTVIEKNYQNLTINSGVTITAGNYNAGIIIRCKGNCTINGTIINRKSAKLLTTAEASAVEAKYPSWMLEHGNAGGGGTGGKGGYVEAEYRASGGTKMNGRFYGGGWSGGGGGGSGVNFGSHGAIGGGKGGRADTVTTSVQDSNLFKGGNKGSSGGWGQDGTYCGGGGGGGGFSYAGSGFYYTGASNGATGAGANSPNASSDFSMIGFGGGAGNVGGGVVVIICGGTLSIDGSILCNGSNGGKCSNASSTASGGGGGGGGGGRIFLIYRKVGTIVGTFDVYGGIGGASMGSGRQKSDAGADGDDGDKYRILYSDLIRGDISPTEL